MNVGYKLQGIACMKRNIPLQSKFGSSREPVPGSQIATNYDHKGKINQNAWINKQGNTVMSEAFLLFAFLEYL